MEAAISCKFHCTRLQEHWRGYWPEVDPHQLAADVEERLAAAVAAWSLNGIEPLDGGVVALTCAATSKGRPVVLKLNPRGHSDDAQLAGEGDALAFWRATGAAVELYDQRDDGFTLLLERLQNWEIPAGDEEVLTHLDLHGWNVLRTREGWKAIDPKGVRADRHADVWALIDPLTLVGFPRDPGEAEATAARWVDRYAEAAEMDLVKAREWTRIRASAEAQDVHDPGWAAALRRMADALG